jgi:hypothetical protein
LVVKAVLVAGAVLFAMIREARNRSQSIPSKAGGPVIKTSEMSPADEPPVVVCEHRTQLSSDHAMREWEGQGCIDERWHQARVDWHACESQTAAPPLQGPLTFDPEGEMIICRAESQIFPHIPTPFSPSCAFISFLIKGIRLLRIRNS